MITKRNSQKNIRTLKTKRMQGSNLTISIKRHFKQSQAKRIKKNSRFIIKDFKNLEANLPKITK
jgi:hypothetical protein